MPTLIDKFTRAQERVRSYFEEELLLSASVLFLPVLYMTAALALLSGVRLGLWVFPTGILLWGIAVVMLHRKERWQRLLTTLLLLLAVFALAAFLLRFVLDRGWDPRTYHSKIILELLKGVNPYHDLARWSDDIYYTYPAAHWILSASLILWTQIFTASFAFTPIAALAAFLCARRFFTTMPHLSPFCRNVLAFLLAANPIAALCFFTHNVDGLLASTLLSVFLLMLSFIVEDTTQGRTTRLRSALYIVALLVLLVNLKFTGLVYGGILGLTALAYGIRRGANRRTLLRLAGLGSGAAILGVALFGFYPYATNVMHGKNPFYPAISYDEQGNRVDVVAQHVAKEFYDKSSYEKWWISLFSQSGRSNWHPVPLAPFSSLHPSNFPLTFGPIFSGAWLLCLSLVFFVRHRGAWIVLAGVMTSILSTSAGFHFRLSPQNWWLPLLLLVFLLAPDKKQPPLSRAPRAIVFVIVACLFYVSFQSFKFYGSPAIELARVVRQLELQGGWFIVSDPGVGNDGNRKHFFNYYKSGLSGVRLPTLSECPDTAEQRRPLFGLVLCRP